MPVISRAAPAQVEAAVSPGVTRSLDTALAPHRGRLAIAEGLADVGGVLGQVATASAQLKNRADQLRVEQAIKADEADFQTWLETEPDETKWGVEADKRSRRVRESIASLKLAPVVRRQAEERLGAWAQDRQVVVANQAQRQTIKRNDDVLVAEIGIASDAGDKVAIDSLFDERLKLGTIHPDVASVARRQAYEQADAAIVARDIRLDPRLAIDKLAAETEGGKPKYYKDMSETARLSAVRSAKNALETMRAETAQEIAAQIFRQQMSGLDERLDYEVKTGGLTAETAANLRAFARGQRTPIDQASAGAQLWQHAIDLEPSDPNYIQEAMKLRASVQALDPVVRQPIIDVLNAKETDDVKEDTQRVYEALARDFRANTFGNAQTWTQGEIDALSGRDRRKAGNPVEGDPKDRKAYEEASAALFRHQRAMREFLQANPKATTEQIQAYRAQLTATDRQASLGGIAFDALSGAVPR